MLTLYPVQCVGQEGTSFFNPLHATVTPFFGNGLCFLKSFFVSTHPVSDLNPHALPWVHLDVSISEITLYVALQYLFLSNVALSFFFPLLSSQFFICFCPFSEPVQAELCLNRSKSENSVNRTLAGESVFLLWIPLCFFILFHPIRQSPS